MPTVLPVPLAFALPDRWTPIDPDVAGAPGVAFAARYATDADFTPNIALDGDALRPGETLDDMARTSVRTLRADLEVVRVLERRDAGSPAAPAIIQVLAITQVVGEVRRDLVQDQVYVLFQDSEQPTARAYVRATFTCSREQHSALVPDFRRFVASIELDEE